MSAPAATTFQGFGEDCFDFYDGLAADPTKAYWDERKPLWLAAVREPVEALVADLEPTFGRAKVFRPNRDVRFAKDKRPYKDHQGAVIEADGSGALYVQVSARGMLVAGGMWQMAPDQVARWREACGTASSLPVLLEKLGAVPAGEPPTAEPAWSLPEPTLVRVPKPYDTAHPMADLLRCRQVSLSKAYAPAEWMHTPQAAEVVARDWTELQALREWLAAHVGASRAQEPVRDTLRGRT